MWVSKRIIYRGCYLPYAMAALTLTRCFLVFPVHIFHQLDLVFCFVVYLDFSLLLLTRFILHLCFLSLLTLHNNSNSCLQSNPTSLIYSWQILILRYFYLTSKIFPFTKHDTERYNYLKEASLWKKIFQQMFNV